MGADLTSRAIIGMFYRELEEARASSWADQIAFRVDSDQAVEELAFLSSAPVMREWIGGRQAKGFDTKTIRVPNKHFEATIEFTEEELRRDKTGQAKLRIKELASRAAAHPRRLLSDLLLAGETSLCYDGQFFFDTDHSEGDSGTQSNHLTVDVTALGVPLAQQGTPTSPSAWVLAEAIARTVTQMKGFRDDAGEPMHAAAKQFMAMLPTSLFPAAAGLGREQFAFDVGNILHATGYSFSIELNARLNGWTDKFVLMRTDAPMKPLIFQQETQVSLKAKTTGSDFTFDTDLHQFGCDAWFNAAYGFWQFATLVQLV